MSKNILQGQNRPSGTVGTFEFLEMMQWCFMLLGRQAAPWRDSRKAAMADAVAAGYAVWDDQYRQHFLTVPASIIAKNR